MGRGIYVGSETSGNVQPPLSPRNKRENRNLQSRCLVCIVVSCLVYIVVVVLCVLLSSYVYLLYCVCIAVFTLDA